jgi:hypothetical protein
VILKKCIHIKGKKKFFPYGILITKQKNNLELL